MEDLPEGGTLTFSLDGGVRHTGFLVRKDGEVRAYLNACPHMPGSRLAWREHGFLAPDGGSLVCHGHGSRFDILTGVCLEGAALGRSLQALPLRVDPGGEILLLASVLPGLS